MWPRFEPRYDGNNPAKESGISHLTRRRVRSQWSGMLSPGIKQSRLSRPDPNEQVGHTRTGPPLGSWPVGTSPSSWRGPGKPQQQRHDPAGLQRPR